MDRPAPTVLVLKQPTTWVLPLLLQCTGLSPVKQLDDGSDAQFNLYQDWWQTLLVKIAPELRGLGWANFKSVGRERGGGGRLAAAPGGGRVRRAAGARCQ